MFSLSCLMPVPPVFGVPFLSITLSHSFLAATPSFRVATSSLTTSNSPRKRGSLLASMVYLSILKRQAMTQAVVALERPTWSLMMMGVLMPVPTRFSQIVSKSAMLGAAELQTGTLRWTSPGKASFSPSITFSRVFRSLTSTSCSFLLMSTYFSLSAFSFMRPSTTLMNSGSSALRAAVVTAPSSVYSPILLGGLAQMGVPLTYTLGSCLMFSQMILPSLG